MTFGVMFWTWNSPILTSPTVWSHCKMMGHPPEKPKGYGTTLTDFPVPQEDSQALLLDFWVGELVAAIKIVMMVMKRTKLSCWRIILVSLRREMNHYFAAKPTKDHQLNYKDRAWSWRKSKTQRHPQRSNLFSCWLLTCSSSVHITRQTINQKNPLISFRKIKISDLKSSLIQEDLPNTMGFVHYYLESAILTCPIQ